MSRTHIIATSAAAVAATPLLAHLALAPDPEPSLMSPMALAADVGSRASEYRSFLVEDPGGATTTQVFTVPSGNKFVLQSVDVDARGIPGDVENLVIEIEDTSGGVRHVLRATEQGLDDPLVTEFRFGPVLEQFETLQVTNHAAPGTPPRTGLNIVLSGVLLPADSRASTYFNTVDNAEVLVYQQALGTKGMLAAYGIADENPGGGSSNIATVTIKDAQGSLVFELPRLKEGRDLQAKASWMVLQPGWSVWIRDWNSGPAHTVWCTVLNP